MYVPIDIDYNYLLGHTVFNAQVSIIKVFIQVKAHKYSLLRRSLSAYWPLKCQSIKTEVTHILTGVNTKHTSVSVFIYIFTFVKALRCDGRQII